MKLTITSIPNNAVKLTSITPPTSSDPLDGFSQIPAFSAQGLQQAAPLRAIALGLGEGAKQVNAALTGQSGTPLDYVNPIGYAMKGITSLADFLGGAVNNIATNVTNPVFSAIGSGLRQAVGPQNVDEFKNALVSSPVTKVASAVATNPDVKAAMGAVGNTANLGMTEAALGQAAPALSELGASPVARLLKGTPINENAVNNIIDTNFTKAVKPSIAGKSSEAQVAKYSENARSAIKAVVQNKDNLSYTTPDGIETGRLPQTRQELAQAVDQTRKMIFDQYDALAKKASGEGAKVNLRPAAVELDTVIDNKALEVANPSAIQYAKTLQERLWKAGKLDTTVVQDVITHMNEKLQAFYKNPSPNAASEITIDAFVVGKLRNALDSAIEGATGAEYQPIKSLYGSLKAIEKDVTKAGLRAGNAAPAGLFDLSNIASGAELARALITMNPADFAVSGAIKGFSAYYKWLNNPDTMIKSMFNKLDSYYTKGPGEAPPIGLGIKDVSGNKSSNGLRPGQPPIGTDWNEATQTRIDLSNTVARERFDIPKLKKLSFGGSDRDVYDLPNGNVLKIAKTARGLDQNIYSSDYYAEGAGLIPKTIEVGKNYIVKEKVDFPDANTKQMVKELKDIGAFYPSTYSHADALPNRLKAYEIMNKHGFSGDDLANYDVLWGDIQAIRNWGTKNGKPILLDEGTLNGDLVKNAEASATGGTKNLADPTFREIYNQSRAAKKKYGDTGPKKLYRANKSNTFS